MRYSFDITIPKNTPASDPLNTQVRLDTGTLTQVMLKFKSGCHGLVYVSIYDALEQIVPASGGDGINGDNLLVSVPMQHELTSPPYNLIVSGWSPDTRYDHVISLWFDLLETANKKSTTDLQSLSYLLGGGA